jgi:hypothetical protein
MEWKKKKKEKLLSIRDLALGACSQVKKPTCISWQYSPSA